MDPCLKRTGKNAFSVFDIHDNISEQVINIKINNIVYIFFCIISSKSRCIPAYTSGLLGQDPGSKGQESAFLISFPRNSYDQAHLRITITYKFISPLLTTSGTMSLPLSVSIMKPYTI